MPLGIYTRMPSSRLADVYFERLSALCLAAGALLHRMPLVVKEGLRNYDSRGLGQDPFLSIAICIAERSVVYGYVIKSCYFIQCFA